MKKTEENIPKVIIIKKSPIGKGRYCENCGKHTLRFVDEIAIPLCLFACSKCGYEEASNT